MNRDRIAGGWKQLKGRLIEQWYSLRDDRTGMLPGRRQQIAGRMQDGYGLATERSARQLSEWRRHMQHQQPARNARAFHMHAAASDVSHGAAANVVCITHAKLHLART